MSKKQKAIAFEFFSFAIIFTAAFGVWVMVQSLALVYPESVVEASSYESSVGRATLTPAKEDSINIDKQIQKQKELQSLIDEFTAKQSGVYSIYIEELDGGVIAEHNSDVQLYSASLYKLFAAQLAYEKVDNYDWSLSQKMSTGQTLNECLEDMITVSDNDCGIAILRALEYNQLGIDTMTKLGYLSTDLTGTYTKTSATDVAKLFRDLYAGNLVSENSSQSFLNLLAAQKINDRLPQGLPDGVQIMHKTGDLEGYVHDAGIVRSVNGSGYIIVVMSGPDSTQTTYLERYEKIANLSSSVYKLLSSEPLK